MEKNELYHRAKKISRQLITVMREGQVSDDQELKEWFVENEFAKEIVQELMDEKKFQNDLDNFVRAEKEEQANLLVYRIRRYQKRRQIYRWSGVAAAILILLSVGFLWRWEVREAVSLVQHKPVTDSLRPFLILANGQNITLDIQHKDAVAVETADLFYMSENQEKLGQSRGQQGVRNTLVVPKACNYRIKLEDGTIVHMNAESQLIYPAQFKEQEREVWLKGEAYFEVAHEKRPFRVRVDQVNIQVYGTKFNVDAYQPSRIKTVLVEGKVGVRIGLSEQNEQILQPCQLSCVDLNRSEQIITDVEVEKYISWTTGFLRYDNDCLEDLMDDLVRWYDVEFECMDPELKNIRFTASINKDSPLEDVLEMIQNTVKINFIKSERRYIVTR